MTSIVQSAITLLLFVLILGALVLVHEVGHFLVARLARIRVHEFGIGFPPRARVLRSEGETLYTLNWLPIGGFVRLEGEDGESNDPRAFVRAPFLTRQIVLIAGVTMNLLLAFVIFSAVALLPQRTLVVDIGKVQPDSPAERAGLTASDRIVSVDGVRYDIYDAQFQTIRLITDLRAKAGATVALGILRPDGRLDEVSVTLRSPAELGPDKGALGVADLRGDLLDEQFQRDPATAVAVGARRTVEAFRFILDGLAGLVRSFIAEPTKPPEAAGPIGIAQQIGQVLWQAGPVPTLYLAGILSANLALVNLLPFPPLDGGRMLFLFLKALAGQRLSVRVERVTYVVGFAFLFAFLIWISVFDVARLGGAIR